MNTTGTVESAAKGAPASRLTIFLAREHVCGTERERERERVWISQEPRREKSSTTEHPSPRIKLWLKEMDDKR